MVGRIWLGVLYLSGWNISTCLLLQFHFVADRKTWTEAQAYCRENHRDLATVTNTEENNQLIRTSSGSQAWIGLYSPVKWRWSDGYNGIGAGHRSWEAGGSEPNFFAHEQFCVSMLNGEWSDYDCMRNFTLICNNGTQLNPEFVAVNEKMTWPAAQRYCRENFMDLATVRSLAENQEINTLVQIYSSVQVTKWWIGLFRDPNMFWSDGSSYSFNYWFQGPNPIGSVSVLCAASQSSGSWKMKSCDTKLPFVCYSSSAQVRPQVVKLRMKPEDSSVDLNDPAVKANVLKKIQDRLMEKGVSGVNLKWREQPDGKVFHKERNQEGKSTFC